MPTLDFESDQFLQLLTDALRAGPGSPDWHEAVEVLRGNGMPQGDEFQLLLTARENLEKGREYRSVRAGAGFSKRVNDALDEESATSKKLPPTVSVVAIISAGLLLLGAGVLLYMLFPGGAPTAAIEQLTNTYFVNTLVEASFDTAIPPDFNIVGSLPVEAKGGLRPILRGAPDSARSGGLVWDQKIPANQPVSIEATLRVIRPSDDTVAEIFISDQPVSGGEGATAGHEFQCLSQNAQAKVVLPTGKVDMQSLPYREFRGTVDLRIVMDREAAIVFLQNKQIWSGAHGLNASSDRYVGLRFIRSRQDGSGDSPMAITWMKVSKP